ncbi:hypothetical protein ACOSP7_023694 [Xanthoceras sorbifolium]
MRLLLTSWLKDVSLTKTWIRHFSRDQILKRENDPRQINHLHQIKQPTIKLVIPVGLNDASGSTSEWCSPIRVSELQ